MSTSTSKGTRPEYKFASSLSAAQGALTSSVVIMYKLPGLWNVFVPSASDSSTIFPSSSSYFSAARSASVNGLLGDSCIARGLWASRAANNWAPSASPTGSGHVFTRTPVPLAATGAEPDLPGSGVGSGVFPVEGSYHWLFEIAQFLEG